MLDYPPLALLDDEIKRLGLPVGPRSFRKRAKDSGACLVLAAALGSLAGQTVAIGGGSVQSAAAKTKFVRLHTDAVCSIKFGTNPTASGTTARMAAGQTNLFGMPVNQAFQVAVIANR